MGTAASPDLVARSHANFIETFRAITRALPGGRIEEFDGIVCLASGIPASPFNPAMVLRPPAEPAAALAQAAAFHACHGLPWMLRTLPEAAEAMTPIAEAAGMTPGGAMPGMVLSPLAGSAPEVPGLRIEVVRTMTALHTYLDVLAAGFEMPREITAAMEYQPVLDAPDFTYYLGYVNDEPATTALRYVSHRIAGVYNISTIPAYRKRGLGEVMAWRAALDGLDDGCIASSLQASAMGFPIYERMGYQRVATYPSWNPPAAS